MDYTDFHIIQYGIGGGYNDKQYQFFKGKYEDAVAEARRLTMEMMETYGLFDEIEADDDDDSEMLVEEEYSTWAVDCILSYSIETLQKIEGHAYVNSEYKELKEKGFLMLEDNIKDCPDWELS